MAITRIKNNQITDATIVASSKLVNASISANKLANDLTYGSNLVISGNLTVNGTTTSLDTVNTIIEDPIILLAKNESGTPSKDIGFIGERGDSNNVAWIFDETDDTFKAGLTTDDGTGTAITLASKVDGEFKDLTMVNLGPTGNVTTALNASAAITAGTTITGIGNVTGGNLNTAGKVVATGAVQGGSITDGTATITSGAGSGFTTITGSGAITGGSITDGTATLSSGSIASGVNGTFSGTVTASTKVSTPDVEGAAITITATGTNDSVTLAPTGSGTIIASSKRITSVGTPTGDNDAANKSYVDGVASGLDIKGSSVAATTAALAAVTYNNGSSGVGATLTADANGALAAQDGVTLLATERLLVKNQVAQLQNGIYTVTTVGDGSNPFVLTRATDFDTAAEIPGGFTFIEEGTTNADNGFVCTTNAGLTVGTTAIVFEQFSGAGQITAGDGLAKSGDTLSVNVDDVTTAISSDAVIVKTSANLTTPNIGVANGTSFTASGAVQGASLTDGTATITSGAGSGFTTITSTGNITTGAGNVIAGNVTGAIGDFSGAVSGSTLTSDSGITISANDIDSSGSAITVNQASADLDFVVEGNGDANLFRTDAGSDTVLISTATATTGATLKIDSTDAMMIPSGTTAQRPTGVTSMLRFNTSTDSLEFYDSDSWTTAGSDFTVIASQTFSGDNSTVAFTLSDTQTTASCIVAINGVVQLPTTAYAVSGTTMTFTEAPASGDVIEVRKLTTTSSITSLANGDNTAVVEAVDGAAQVKITGSLLPVASDGGSLGSAALEWADLFIADAGTIQFGDDQDVTITHVADTGLLINGTSTLAFTDAAESISSNGSRLILTSNSVAFRMPTADGSSGQAMVTDASGNLSFAAAGATVSQDNSSNTAFNLYFAATTSGALTAVKYDGGTLTFNPSSETLAVTNVTGVSSSAKYADLAEKYAADEDIEAGTVVHFAGEGKLAACDEANHHAVAGIISTDPAYLMNSDQEGVALAISGRVPCKVTGTIAAGDLMVSAGNGMAMANNSPAIGTVIGKAIEAHEGGEGTIEVLAMMM